MRLVYSIYPFMLSHDTPPPWHPAASIFHMRVKSRRRLLDSVMGPRALLTRCRLQQERSRGDVHVACSCIHVPANSLEVREGQGRAVTAGGSLWRAPLLRLGLDMTLRIYLLHSARSPLSCNTFCSPSTYPIPPTVAISQGSFRRFEYSSIAPSSTESRSPNTNTLTTTQA